ncbi:MAG: hypothetical protein JXL97_17865 [Bacteroidales bacterium]|nr:hypothetical protein [Bacteroidales bacterium]
MNNQRIVIILTILLISTTEYPQNFEIHFIILPVEVVNCVGAHGVKEIGEIGLVPTAGAIANALYQYDKIRR